MKCTLYMAIVSISISVFGTLHYRPLPHGWMFNTLGLYVMNVIIWIEKQTMYLQQL